jgi:UDP-3-O-[3-hydroxymyristoyl] glucosamine N-acyltransferase
MCAKPQAVYSKGETSLTTTIHPSALVEPGAVLGERVTVAAGACIGSSTQLGDDCFIGPHCVIGEPARGYYKDAAAYQPAPVRIGAGSILRTGTIIYHGVQIGVQFQTGPYAVVRENTVFGRNCSLGNNCDVQADVKVGDYTRCHSNVTLGQYSIVGNYCWFMPYVLLMNDYYPPNYHDPRGARVGDFSVLGGRVVVFPVDIGKHVVSAANAVISKSIPDFSMIRGDPAERVGDCRHLIATRADGKKYRPYPWPNHRSEGYPFTPEMLAELNR